MCKYACLVIMIVFDRRHLLYLLKTMKTTRKTHKLHVWVSVTCNKDKERPEKKLTTTKTSTVCDNTRSIISQLHVWMHKNHYSPLNHIANEYMCVWKIQFFFVCLNLNIWWSFAVVSLGHNWINCIFDKETKINFFSSLFRFVCQINKTHDTWR